MEIEIPFVEFPKMPRLSREIVVTEKIDGSNAQVHITDDGRVLAGSRSRWITPQADNFGFASWVEANKAELLELGPGSRERLGQTDAHQRALTAIRLIKIAWGKPDRELAKVVRTSIEAATPATVIPWAPGQAGLRRRLRSMHVHTDIDDQPVAHVHRFVSVEELK